MKNKILILLSIIGVVVIATTTVILAQGVPWPYSGNYPDARAKDIGLNRGCDKNNPCIELFVNGYHAEPYSNIKPAAPGNPIVLSWRTDGVRDCYISRQSSLNNCAPNNATDCLESPQKVKDDDSMNVTAANFGATYYRLQCRLQSDPIYINHDIAFFPPGVTPPVTNPLVITDTCPTCGDAQINFTINATPQACS